MPVCKCGRQILFGKTPEGKFVPLDSVAPVYSDVTPELEVESGTMKVARIQNAYVSHFSTCKYANEFGHQKHKQVTSDKH